MSLGMNLGSHLRRQRRQLARDSFYGICRRLPSIVEDALKVNGGHLGYVVGGRRVLRDSSTMVVQGGKMAFITLPYGS